METDEAASRAAEDHPNTSPNEPVVPPPESEPLVELVLKDGLDPDLLQDDDCKTILEFLYARGYYKRHGEKRLLDMIQFLDPTSASHERLLRVIYTEQDRVTSLDPSEDTTKYCEGWLDLLKTSGYMGEKKQTDTMTVFDEHQLTPVFRRQSVSNCFLHGPAVAHCYALQIGMNKFEGVLDLAKYIRQNFSDEDLSDYIQGKGGDSTEFFSQILENSMSLQFRPTMSERQLEWEFDVLGYLVESGPALVAEFAVDKNFAGHGKTWMNGVLPYFSGNIDRNAVVGTHSMVLIGMRRAGNETLWLLQNWWNDMQFVEVTTEYLVSSGAKLMWPYKRQTRLDASVPMSQAIFAETHVDGCDSRKLLPDCTCCDEIAWGY